MQKPVLDDCYICLDNIDLTPFTDLKRHEVPCFKSVNG